MMVDKGVGVCVVNNISFSKQDVLAQGNSGDSVKIFQNTKQI